MVTNGGCKESDLTGLRATRDCISNTPPHLREGQRSSESGKPNWQNRNKKSKKNRKAKPGSSHRRGNQTPEELNLQSRKEPKC